MNINKLKFLSRATAADDGRLAVHRKDMSGGVNSRMPSFSIGETQATALYNISLDVSGESSKRPGSVLIGNDVSDNSVVCLHNYSIQGETDQLLMVEGQNLRKWTGGGNWSAALKSDFTAGLTDYGFVSAKQSGLSPDDVVIVQNGVDNAFLIDSAGTAVDLLANAYYSIPKTTVMCWYGNKVWALKDNLLAFSTAYPSQYYPDAAQITGDVDAFTGVAGDKLKVTIDSSIYDDIDISSATSIDNVVTAINTAVGSSCASKTAAGYLQISSSSLGLSSNVTIADGTNTTHTVVGDLFTDAATRNDTGIAPFAITDSFRIPVGEERGLAPTRDMGIVVLGKYAIWSINPSTVPVATDKPEPLVPNMGCVSKKGWAMVGDDIYFFSHDGLRSLKRTVQDKLQVGANYPISYRLKAEFARISWGYISKLSMAYFDNKIFISVPTSETTYDTWIYYPAIDAFSVIQGWNVRSWATYSVNGEERLYYGKDGDGAVYRAWYGYTDEGTTITNGTAISLQEEGREEDFGQPLVTKSGGEVEVVVARTGDYLVSVYASFDGEDYTKLGDVEINQSFINFPTVFPVAFIGFNRTRKKFHLDSYPAFKTIKLKIVHDDTNTTDITIYERNIVTYQNEYESEEE